MSAVRHDNKEEEVDPIEMEEDDKKLPDFDENMPLIPPDDNYVAPYDKDADEYYSYEDEDDEA